MPERNLDFDTVIDRTDTSSLKFDFFERRGRPADALPFWVADMDFKTSSYIQDALYKQVEHGIFGYSETKEEYFAAVQGWMKRHHNYDVTEDWLIKTPGVVFALAMCVKAYTNPGDAVLIQQPVYYPFSEVIEDNGRKLVSNDLVLGEDGQYHIDFEDFEEKIQKYKIRLFLFCSPHNPGGRVWTREELTKIGDICVRNHVIVASDEIHEDFAFRRPHTVFATVRPEFADISITCTSPSKTFNLAGLQTSNNFIPNPELRQKFQHEVDAAGYSQLSVMGLIATRAAYNQGEEWLTAVKRYIQDNIEYTVNTINHIPGLSTVKPDGTYLIWFDCRGLGLNTQQLDDFILHDAKLWLDSGAIFGPCGEGFQRINVACPRATLEQGLSQLEEAVRHGRAES